MDVIPAALESVLQWQVLLVIFAAAVYGIFVGAIPGLTATMAIALMVPLTFYLSDVQAIAAIVTAVTCSIFAGDIPAALVRIPGTPASAAYASDAYALTCRGAHRSALVTSLVFSVTGGLLGTLVLACAAPQLAAIAASFTSFEYFWLVVLGLSCSVVVSDGGVLASLVALSIGLLLSTVGLGTDFSVPRLTLGFNELVNGVGFIPAMIGLFGISEVLRLAGQLGSKPLEDHRGNPSTYIGANVPTTNTHNLAPDIGQPLFSEDDRVPSIWRRKWHVLRSSGIGACIGMLPGAGADIAAWIAYAMSKRFSSTPQRYGRGSVDGIADASGANNAALGGAWIPALVFGIPGDSVTAIALGVLLMKNITPGPNIFDSTVDPHQATLVACVYITFVVANLVLLPVGWLAIRAGGQLVRVPRGVLLPMIVLFCIVGSYSISASYVDVWIMLVMGIAGCLFERLKIPLAPIVLGLILGGDLEHRFIQCITTASGVGSFVASPITSGLVAVCLFVWLFPLLARRPAMTSFGDGGN